MSLFDFRKSYNTTSESCNTRRCFRGDLCSRNGLRVVFPVDLHISNLQPLRGFINHKASTVYRKFWSYSLLIFYLFAATGVEVRAHYCGAELHSITLYGDAEKGCCGDAEAAAGCCHDEIVKSDLSEDQHLAKVLKQAAPDVSWLISLPAVFSGVSPLPSAPETRSVPLRHSPPRSPGVAIYLANQVFRI
jgi:hypothetical protein